jgi:prephenate dehydrogenase
VNIDQRLEALTARHEALSQSLELLAAMQQDNEKRWERRLEAYDQRLEKITTAIQQDAENIRALARVAELHHQRLERLEDLH